MRHHQAELEKTMEAAPVGDLGLHEHVKDLMEKTLTYERYRAIGQLFERGDYFAVRPGTKLALPRQGYLYTFLGFALNMGGEPADLVFAVDLKDHPTVAKAHRDYLESSSDLTDAHVRAFNALPHETRRARIHAHHAAVKKIKQLSKDTKVSPVDRNKLRAELEKQLLPRGTVARADVIFRQPRTKRAARSRNK